MCTLARGCVWCGRRGLTCASPHVQHAAQSAVSDALLAQEMAAWSATKADAEAEINRLQAAT